MSWKCPECGYQSRLEQNQKTVAFWCGRCKKAFEVAKSEFAVEDVTFHRGRDMFEPEVPPFVGFVQEYPEPSAEIPYVIGADVAAEHDNMAGEDVGICGPKVRRIPSTSPLAKRYGA